MSETVLEIPRPPSANTAFRNLAGGGRAKTRGYRAWREEAGWTVKTQSPAKITGEFEVEIVCPRPDNRRRDIDNLIKPTLDLLVLAGVTPDDSRCRKVSAEWGAVHKKKPMRVTVRAA